MIFKHFCGQVVKFLDSHPLVDWVSYPEIGDEKQKKLAEKQFKNGVGSIFTFGIKGGKEAGRKFIDSVELFSHLANVADAKSLVIHPASTTHSQLTIDELAKCKIHPETIRISIGLENIDDLIVDLENALKKSQEV